MYATYLRVSTRKQGASGLGLEAQRKMCNDYITQCGGGSVQEFMDVESGTHRNRRGLQQAINFCKANGCKLVIAKLDRLCRDVEFCFKVVNTGIDIHFCDMPTINTLLLGVFAAVAQYERELTSDRTKKALAVKKTQGVMLGAANSKYQQTMSLKTEEEKKEISMKRGEMKRKHNLESRDMTAMLRILRIVFPDATNGEPTEWKWSKISTANGAKDKIYALMKDYKEMDDTGATFKKWTFTETDERKKQQKLGGYLMSIKRAILKF